MGPEPSDRRLMLALGDRIGRICSGAPTCWFLSERSRYDAEDGASLRGYPGQEFPVACRNWRCGHMRYFVRVTFSNEGDDSIDERQSRDEMDAGLLGGLEFTLPPVGAVNGRRPYVCGSGEAGCNEFVRELGHEGPGRAGDDDFAGVDVRHGWLSFRRWIRAWIVARASSRECASAAKPVVIGPS